MNDAVGQWIEVTQEMVNKFADATGDRQWIHVDPERAQKESPFKRPIAHGFLIMSLAVRELNKLTKDLPIKLAINYGMNKVRWVSPVPVGSHIRMRFHLTDVKRAEPNFLYAWIVTVEIEGSSKPAMVAEWLLLWDYQLDTFHWN